MKIATIGRRLAVASAAVVTAGLLSVPAQAAPPPEPPPGGDPGRYLVVARTAAEYAGLRDEATASGAKVVREMPEIKTFVMVAATGASSSVLADSRVLGVAADQLRSITTEDRPEPNLSSPGLRGATEVQVPAAASASASTAAAGIDPDPAFDYRGLLWNYRRIGLPQGWRTTAGRPAVTVGVADTGLDFTHAELRPQVRRVIDLTQTEDPPICETFFGTSDQELAARFGGPARTDWNGHGTWIGGNIAAALNGTGMNGIAPRVGLVSLKISQWCGFAYDSTILAAFLTAANARMDVVSISFGGYLDRSAPDHDLIYRLYAGTVAFARSQGTTIVASAGNDHVRIGAGGRVVSHGSLTPPGGDLFDLFGWYQTPGGVPGVVNVSATNNVVNGPSRGCPPGSTGTVNDPDATCKPARDRHQPFGVGRTDQLAYYSNYGPRIDIAAPGGARKFNLPVWDRGGTPGFPYTTADLTTVWEVFSTTSNWAVEIPCFTFSRAAGFPERQCYTSIQGTSMAAPHVSAAIALTASAHPGLRHRPAALIARVTAHAVDRVNRTPGLSRTDRSPGDLIRQPCETGFCHLGGPAIPSGEAYGAGLLNVARP